jgi:hypothetical protein
LSAHDGQFTVGSGGGKVNISGITASEIRLRIIKILEPLAKKS